MTIKRKTAAAILALTSAAALIPSAARATIIYNDGDLLLGFRATGGQGMDTDYLVNLGGAASIVNSPVPITFSIGDISADLTALYGDWFARADVRWSVSGVQKFAGNGFGVNTMFATRWDSLDLNAPLGTNTTTPWLRPSPFGAGVPAGKMQSMAYYYLNYMLPDMAVTGIESTNAPGALIQLTDTPNSYASFQPGGVNTTGATAFGYFLSSLNGVEGLEGSFANGTAESVLDLYLAAPGPRGANPQLPAVFAGNITIDDDGDVTFTPPVTGPVPEPSTAAALALGGIVLASASMRRRCAR